MKSTVFELIAWLTCARLISAQTLISALEARPELVLFNDYIQSVPGLLNTLTNATNYTLLAPSDTAMTRWLNDSSPPPSQDKIEATLYYHLLHGGYSLGSFSATPQFASSYLTNSSWTNVTGGAVVQLVESGGNPSMVSALGQHSSVTKGVRTPPMFQKNVLTPSGSHCQWRTFPHHRFGSCTSATGISDRNRGRYGILHRHHDEGRISDGQGE